MKQKVLELIGGFTGKKHVKLTNCGDSAIILGFLTAKSFGKQKIAIPDQGGWLGFRKIAVKLDLEVIEVKTDCGIIDLRDLKAKIDEKTALIITNMAGYFAQNPIKDIEDICKKEKAIFILDITDSIKTKSKAELVLASFGKWKPLDLGYGGFIATDNKDFFNLIEKESLKYEFDENKLEELEIKLVKLDKRMKKFDLINKKIKKDLKAFDILHKDKKGINVIVKFKNNEEKRALIKYCEENKLEYTLCPRYIRVNENAVSIEVKRS